MKNHFLIFTTFITLALLISISMVSTAQPPPPPAGHGLSGNQAPKGPDGAPVGDGLFFLIGLAGLYGGKKIYDIRKAPKLQSPE